MGSLGHLWCMVTDKGKGSQDVSTKDDNNKIKLGIHLRRDYCAL